MSKIFPSIPDPVGNIASLLDVTRTMKHSVELLAGQRGSVAPTRVFVQSATPTAEQVGDMWVSTSANNRLLVWDGRNWSTVTL